MFVQALIALAIAGLIVGGVVLLLSKIARFLLSGLVNGPRL